MDNCVICNRRVLRHSLHIKCTICEQIYHVKCITLEPDHITWLQANENSWFCSKCLADCFPFNGIDDDIEFKTAINQLSESDGKSLCYLSDKIFMPFEINDEDDLLNICDSDPDLHFYNSISQCTCSSNYYLESSFQDRVRQHASAEVAFSLCHANLRSAKKI